MKCLSLFSRPFATIALASVLASPSTFAWGPVGHTMINRLAAQALAGQAPAFLSTPAAIDEIAYLGPEPDRWRSTGEPELNNVQAPDHFINFENADVVGKLPKERYEFLEDLCKYRAAHPDQAADETPERVGMQPWETEEVWERLKSSFREYRKLSAAHEDTKPVEQAILFYAGWLGHYVADGSQPLHVTRDYNGWTEKENPNHYSNDKKIHWQFESNFINDNIKDSDVKPLLSPVKPIGDEWDDYLAYLHHSGSFVEQTYALYRDGGFTTSVTPASKQFAAERLAAGASMLRDMIVAAWQKSADPVPERHYE